MPEHSYHLLYALSTFFIQGTCLAYPACLAVVWDNACGYLKTSSTTVDHGIWSTYIKVGGTSNASEGDNLPGTQPPSAPSPATVAQTIGEGTLVLYVQSF
jgi:hypothetical protein